MQGGSSGGNNGVKTSPRRNIGQESADKERASGDGALHGLGVQGHGSGVNSNNNSGSLGMGIKILVVVIF